MFTAPFLGPKNMYPWKTCQVHGFEILEMERWHTFEVLEMQCVKNILIWTEYEYEYIRSLNIDQI